jgi:alkylhydroperoxidase/carboxymuconolactone decarboxylase family protein YurZ
MKEKLRFLGLDVHAETIAAAIAQCAHRAVLSQFVSAVNGRLE